MQLRASGCSCQDTHLLRSGLLNPCLLHWTGFGAAAAGRAYQLNTNRAKFLYLENKKASQPASCHSTLRLAWQEVSPSVSTAVKTPELRTVVIRFQRQQASEATCPKQRGWGGSCLSHSPCLGLLRLQKKMMRLSHLAGFLNDPKAHKHGSRLSSHLHQCKSVALKSQPCPERRLKCLDGALGLFKQNLLSVKVSRINAG